MSTDKKISPSLLEQSKQPKQKHHLSYQGKGINQLSAITQRKVQESAKAQQIELFSKEEGYNKPVRVVSGDVIYTLSNNACVVSGRTIQVIRYLIQKFTEQDLQAYTPEEKELARNVELTIKEVGNKFQMNNATAIKSMLTLQLLTASEMWAEWIEHVYYEDGKTGKKKRSVNKEHYRTRLIGGIKETVPAGQDANSEPQLFKRGKVTVRIDVDFAKYLQNSYIMAINDNFYAISPKKNPYSVAFYDKIMTHYRSNIGKPNQNIIRVKTLLDMTDIPHYEEIAGKGRTNQLMFTPVERDMDNLQELGLIKSWDYCKPNGVPLTKAERKKMTGTQFESYDVYFEMPDDYPAMKPIAIEEPPEIQ